MAAEKVSGAAVFVMMAESFVPRGADFVVAYLEKKRINNQYLAAIVDPFIRPKVLVWNGEDGSHGQR